MICSVRVGQLLAAVMLLGILPIAAQADDPCQGANNCMQVVDTEPYDGNLSDELQAAWNSLAYADPPHERIVLYPPPAQASGSPRYRLDKRVRFCFDGNGPAAPECEGIGALPTIEFAGLWDLECNLDNPQGVLQSSDYCLWIGDAWNDGFDNLLNVTGRIRMHRMNSLMQVPVVPLFCDGCTGAGPLRYEETWGGLNSAPCGVFAGGPKRIDLDCPIVGPVLDGLHTPHTTIAGQVGREAPPFWNSYTVIGTGEPNTWGDADGCRYGADPVDYECHVVIAKGSVFNTSIRTHGPIGTLTIYGAVEGRPFYEALLHRSASGVATPFEAIRIFGSLTADSASSHPAIRIDGNDLAALDPLPTVVIDGPIRHEGTGGSADDLTMLRASCSAPNEDAPIIRIGSHARFQVPSGSASEHWLPEDHSCGVRAWNEESVVARDDVLDSGADPGESQCWNWHSKDWDSCSDDETYWYPPHQAPKVYVTRGQVTVHRQPGSGTSCNLRWLRNGSLLGGEIFELGGDDLNEAGERLARMLTTGVEGDVEYLQLEIDNGSVGGCWPSRDWGAFEVRLEMHEENFHRDPSS